MKTILFFLLAVAATTVQAQNTLVPGKNAADKQWIKNTSYAMTWYFLQDTIKREIGKINTEITLGKDNIIVVTKVSRGNSAAQWVDSTIAEKTTLAPVRHSSYNTQREMVLNFGKVVTGYYNDKKEMKNTLISDTTHAGYFDSNLYPILLGWLPLKESYKQDIAIYDYNPAKMGVLKASVLDVQPGVYNSTKSGSHDVWMVKVTDEIGNGGPSESIYYFDKADRRLWRQEISVAGRKMLIELNEE